VRFPDYRHFPDTEISHFLEKHRVFSNYCIFSSHGKQLQTGKHRFRERLSAEHAAKAARRDRTKVAFCELDARQRMKKPPYV
jgi:hypothetical protein